MPHRVHKASLSSPSPPFTTFQLRDSLCLQSGLGPPASLSGMGSVSSWLPSSPPQVSGERPSPLRKPSGPPRSEVSPRPRSHSPLVCVPSHLLSSWHVSTPEHTSILFAPEFTGCPPRPAPPCPPSPGCWESQQSSVVSWCRRGGNGPGCMALRPLPFALCPSPFSGFLQPCPVLAAVVFLKLSVGTQGNGHLFAPGCLTQVLT